MLPLLTKSEGKEVFYHNSGFALMKCCCQKMLIFQSSLQFFFNFQGKIISKDGYINFLHQKDLQKFIVLLLYYRHFKFKYP